MDAGWDPKGGPRGKRVKLDADGTDAVPSGSVSPPNLPSPTLSLR
jgi:hypothetical protein